MSNVLIKGLPESIEVSQDKETLLGTSVDWWPLALLKRSRGDEPVLPRAVVRPRSTEEVSAVLEWAHRTGTAVVPRGGGSGVCGGSVPPSGSVVLDMTGMSRILSIDSDSAVVHAEAGILGGALEAALNENSLMLGHYPQSFSLSTIGGWIAATSAGQASPGYGSIEDRLLGATVVLPTGRIVRLKPQPRSACGPDLRRLFLGAEGTLGVVTEAWLACAPFSEQVMWDGFRLPTFQACLDAARDIYRAGIHPRVNRGWDEDDTRHGFAALGIDAGSVSLLGFTAGEPGIDDRGRAAEEIFRNYGGEPIGSEPGELWFQHRLDAVNVFKEVMGSQRTLGTGSMIDTVEVAGLWSQLPGLYRGVREVLLSAGASPRCHFSHVYASGACLYTTFTLLDSDDYEVEEHYGTVWQELAAACADSGGTLSHHHGMGRLKARYLDQELGLETANLLREVKRLLDPNNILNPGTLFEAASIAVSEGS